MSIELNKLQSINTNNTSITTHNTAFRGANVTLPNDTIELSTKKARLSTGAKLAIGITTVLASIYGYKVLHRHLTKPSLEKVAKNFSEIFRRNVPKEEAENIVNRYKNLLEIENTEEFIKKAFEQTKKDYGYEKNPIKLKINKIKDYAGSGDAGWTGESGVLSINVLVDKNGKVKNINKRGRKCMLQTIMHEFQHVKQDEIAYRTSRDEIVKAILEKKSDQSDYINKIKDILSKKSKIEIEAKKHNITVEECKKRFEEILKELEAGKYSFDTIKFDPKTKIGLDNVFNGYSKFAKGSKEHNLGLKYIENTKNYIKPGTDRKGYEKQILEAEAFETEKKFEEIYNYFANKWRIPFFQ